jgi:flagellar biosynthesis/type III secretory pathway protein FliH
MSRERMAMPRGIVALRAVAAPPPGSAPAEAPRCIPLAPLELKEIQRRAFERGRAVEREELAARLGALLAALAASAGELDAARSADRGHLARFGVEVALAAAGDLVGSAVKSREHDVRAQVSALLEEALPGIGPGAIQVAVNPADLEALSDLCGPGVPPAVAGRVVLAGDAGLAPGACRIRADGGEFLADPQVRLAAIADRLRAVAAAERPDA